MTHDTWTDRLSEYVDGELDPSTERALEAHLAGCAECRVVADDLRRVSARARALPVVPPSSDLWGGIESRIHEAGIVPLEPARRKGLFVSWPRLAAAAALLGLASGGAVYATLHFRAQPEVAAVVPVAPAVGTPSTDPAQIQVGARVSESTAKAVADLEMILASEKLDSATVRILTLNLARIDSAIADAERALAADPSNAYVSRHLASTARRKVELLHLVAGLTQSRS
jgi:anti-sigma factor RsiW